MGKTPPGRRATNQIIEKSDKTGSSGIKKSDKTGIKSPAQLDRLQKYAVEQSKQQGTHISRSDVTNLANLLDAHSQRVEKSDYSLTFSREEDQKDWDNRSVYSPEMPPEWKNLPEEHVKNTDRDSPSDTVISLPTISTEQDLEKPMSPSITQGESSKSNVEGIDVDKIAVDIDTADEKTKKYLEKKRNGFKEKGLGDVYLNMTDDEKKIVLKNLSSLEAKQQIRFFTNISIANVYLDVLGNIDGKGNIVVPENIIIAQRKWEVYQSLMKFANHERDPHGQEYGFPYAMKALNHLRKDLRQSLSQYKGYKRVDDCLQKFDSGNRK